MSAFISIFSLSRSGSCPTPTPSRTSTNKIINHLEKKVKFRFCSPVAIWAWGTTKLYEKQHVYGTTRTRAFQVQPSMWLSSIYHVEEEAHGVREIIHAEQSSMLTRLECYLHDISGIRLTLMSNVFSRRRYTGMAAVYRYTRLFPYAVAKCAESKKERQLFLSMKLSTRGRIVG